MCSLPALADSRRNRPRFELFAEGTVDDFSLVWPPPQLPPLPPGVIIRVRIEYPIHRHNLLEWLTYLASSDGQPLPNGVVTLLRMRVDNIGLSRTPVPNFGLFGEITNNPVVSPFGELTGLVGMVSAQFDAPGDRTTFTLLSGAAAGNHASALRTATGFLHIRGPWHSF